MIALLLGLWMEGGFVNEAKWQAKVAELEAKLEEAKKESEKVNTVVETQVVTKTKVVKEKADTIIKYIDKEVIKKEEIIKYIEQCPVPKEIIDIHNQAAELNKAAEVKK
jgi:hypothetical protein